LEKIYEEAAKLAYKNSLELKIEARLLLDHSFYSRAYSLAVLSFEEFTKSFLYKGASAGIIEDKDFNIDIRNHEEKLFHITHLLLFYYISFAKHERLLKAIEHDKNEKDHSKHITIQAIEKYFTDSREEKELIDKYLSIFNNMHKLKLKALYVDIQKNKVIKPNEIIDKERSYEIIDLLGFLNGFDIVLGESDEHFKNVVKLIDPQILSGTMKSYFHKYKKSKI
jgi:AbiV family abortive infection protein